MVQTLTPEFAALIPAAQCDGSLFLVMAGHRAGHPSPHGAATDGRDKPGHDDKERSMQPDRMVGTT